MQNTENPEKIEKEVILQEISNFFKNTHNFEAIRQGYLANTGTLFETKLFNAISKNDYEAVEEVIKGNLLKEIQFPGITTQNYNMERGRYKVLFLLLLMNDEKINAIIEKILPKEWELYVEPEADNMGPPSNPGESGFTRKFINEFTRRHNCVVTTTQGEEKRLSYQDVILLNQQFSLFNSLTKLPVPFTYQKLSGWLNGVLRQFHDQYGGGEYFYDVMRGVDPRIAIKAISGINSDFAKFLIAGHYTEKATKAKDSNKLYEAKLFARKALEYALLSSQEFDDSSIMMPLRSYLFLDKADPSNEKNLLSFEIPENFIKLLRDYRSETLRRLGATTRYIRHSSGLMSFIIQYEKYGFPEEDEIPEYLKELNNVRLSVAENNNFPRVDALGSIISNNFSFKQGLCPEDLEEPYDLIFSELINGYRENNIRFNNLRYFLQKLSEGSYPKKLPGYISEFIKGSYLDARTIIHFLEGVQNKKLPKKMLSHLKPLINDLLSPEIFNRYGKKEVTDLIEFTLLRDKEKKIPEFLVNFIREYLLTSPTGTLNPVYEVCDLYFKYPTINEPLLGLWLDFEHKKRIMDLNAKSMLDSIFNHATLANKVKPLEEDTLNFIKENVDMISRQDIINILDEHIKKHTKKKKVQKQVPKDTFLSMKKQRKTTGNLEEEVAMLKKQLAEFQKIFKKQNELITALSQKQKMKKSNK